jgi:hypothetical protein
VEVYIDDIVIHSKNEHEHDRLINEVFIRLEQNNMKINQEKIQWKAKEIKLLGVTLNGREQEASEIKRNEALEYPEPKNISELRRFLGMTGWFSNFIKDYARKTEKLSDGLKGKGKNWKWTSEMVKEFEEIKEELRKLKKLLLADYDKPFMLRTDASNTGLGAVLLQEDENKEWKPIQWASKKLTPTERRYGITEKEMYAVVWGIKKFEYELRGRKFRLVTDHKALTEIRKKGQFNNDRVNRWADLIQEFDFEVEYKKGEELVVPDALSRLYEGEDAETVKNSKMKQAKWEKHVVEQEGQEYWRFDNGVMKKIPQKEERIRIVIKEHEKMNHRGTEPVYYEIKKNYYWPGIKETIAEAIKKCEVCQKLNRKNTGGDRFIETTRRMEKVALDIAKSGKNYVLIAIDYFSRMIWTRILPKKSAEEVKNVIKEWLNEGTRPIQLITDNGKEFSNEKFKRLCWDYGVEHRLVGIEAHKSNGRVERVIRTLREGLLKVGEGNLSERLETVVRKYNSTYHSAIKCAPVEAWDDKTGIAQVENGRNGAYAKQFVIRKREEFIRGQKVRITSRENLGNETKQEKGRFRREGIIIDKCGEDSYLVKEGDKIFKKCHYDLKAKL